MRINYYLKDDKYIIANVSGSKRISTKLVAEPGMKWDSGLQRFKGSSLMVVKYNQLLDKWAADFTAWWLDAALNGDDSGHAKREAALMLIINGSMAKKKNAHLFVPFFRKHIEALRADKRMIYKSYQQVCNRFDRLFGHIATKEIDQKIIEGWLVARR